MLICTHHDLHLLLAIQAAKPGKQIFVEKPLVLTIEACEQIEAAVEHAGVKLIGWISGAGFAIYGQAERGNSITPCDCLGNL